MKKQPSSLPRGFQLIGKASKPSLRATVGKPTIRHRRQFGNRSPLDRLPKKVKHELIKRCKAGIIFKEIRAWLMAGHLRHTSITALSDWWMRQQGQTGSLRSGALEFIVHAPGASEVRVLVKSL